MRNKQKQYEYQSVQVCTSTVSELAWNGNTVGIFAGFCRSPGQNFNNIRAAVSQNVWNNKAWLRIDTFPMNPCLNPSCPYLPMSKLNASQCLPLPGNARKLEICEGHQDLDLSRQSLQSCDLSKFSIVQPLISVPGCSLKSLCQVQISSGCDELQQWAIAFQVLVECSPCTAGSHKNTSHPNGINDCLSIRDFDSIFFCCNRQQFRKGPAKFSDTVQYHDAAWNSGNMKSSWVYMGRPRRRKRRTRRNNICSAWLMNLKLGRVKLQWKGLSRQWNPIISHSLSLSLSLSLCFGFHRY